MNETLFSELLVHPWKERFSKEFFRSLPEVAGVYRFYSVNGNLLYVGKAKNLRARLRSYRHQNLDKASRKLRRLLHAVIKIEWQLESSEESALLSENKLLRSLKPMFNRMNTHPEYYAYLRLEKKSAANECDCWIWHPIQDPPERIPRQQWILGAFKGRSFLRTSLAAFLRIAWLTHHPDQNIWQLPQQYLKDEVFGEQSLVTESRFAKGIQDFWTGRSANLLAEWSQDLLARPLLDTFEIQRIESDLKRLEEFFTRNLRRLRKLRSLSPELRRKSYVPKEAIDDLIVRWNFRKTSSP